VRRSVLVLAVIVAAAACSSFDEGEGAAALAPDGGTDGGADSSVDAPSTDPQLVVDVESVISGLCASNRGVAWISGRNVAGVIDGIRRPGHGDSGDTTGACALLQSTVRFTDSTSIRVYDLDGNAAVAGSIAFGLESPRPVAIHGTTTFTAEATGSRSIIETDDSSTTKQELGYVGASGGVPTAIVANTTYVVVGTAGGEVDLVQRGTFGANVVGNVPNLTGLALAADALYVASAAPPGTIQSCALPACGSFTPIASGRRGPSQVAVDGEDLHWLDRDDGQVVTCKRTSCSPRTLATVAGATHLALGDRIYVADSAGRIYSVAR
jgi:hypothetical protein